MKTTDSERLNVIIRLWEDLSKEIKNRNITPELLLQDAFIQWAITTPLYNIGEQVYNLSPEFKLQHPEIPWNMISGLRHRLVHNYEGINWSVICDVVFREMDEFVTQIKTIIF